MYYLYLILRQCVMIPTHGKTDMGITAALMQKNGVKMEAQHQGLDGHWVQNTITQRAIVVFVARVITKVTYNHLQCCKYIQLNARGSKFVVVNTTSCLFIPIQNALILYPGKTVMGTIAALIHKITVNMKEQSQVLNGHWVHITIIQKITAVCVAKANRQVQKKYTGLIRFDQI